MTGNAKTYLQFKSFDNLDQLLTELKRTYAPPQNLPQIQANLARVVQFPREKVSDYGLRVTQILQKANEMIAEIFDTAVAKGMMEGTTALAIECFVLGLNREIAQLLIGKRMITLEAAISAAVDVEGRVSHRPELHGAKDGRLRDCRIIGSDREQPTLDDHRRKCYKCGEPGHFRRECPSENFVNSRPDLTSENQGYIANDGKARERDKLWCNHCKMRGYRTSECRKRQQLWCHYCKVHGHVTGECKKWLQSWCNHCKIYGHVIEECRNHQKVWCEYHHGWGHATANCRDRSRQNEGTGQQDYKTSSQSLNSQIAHHEGTAMSGLNHPAVPGNVQSSPLTRPGISDPCLC